MNYETYNPIYCLPKDSNGISKRLYTSKLDCATCCDDVLRTPGTPSNISPKLPNSCIQQVDGYYGVWIVNDSSCISDSTLEWQEVTPLTCRNFQLEYSAKLDLHCYAREYWEVIEKNTPLVQDGISYFPRYVCEETGYFDVTDATCEGSKYWVDISGTPGYNAEDCMGKYNNQEYEIFTAELMQEGNNVTSCYDVLSTPGNPNKITPQVPDECYARDGKLLGVWSIPVTNAQCRTNNTLEWEYYTEGCKNNEYLLWYRLNGLNSDLPDAYKKATAKELDFRPSEYTIALPPNDVKVECDEVLADWVLGGCNGNYDFAILFIIFLVLILILVVIGIMFFL